MLFEEKGGYIMLKLVPGSINDKLLLDSICEILGAIKHTDFFNPELVIIATEVTLDRYGLTGTGYTLAPLFRGFPASGTIADSIVWIKEHWDRAGSFVEKVNKEAQEQCASV